MNAAVFLYPLLIGIDILLLVEAGAGRVRYALFVFLILHTVCWVASARGALRSLGFYVSLCLAWLVLGGYAMDGLFIMRALAAVAILFLGLLTWGDGTLGGGFRAPKTHSRRSRFRGMRLALPAFLLGAAAFLLMADPIPRTSKVILDLGSGIRDIAAPFLQGFTGDKEEPEEIRTDESVDSAESDSKDFGLRRKLPASANLRSGTGLHVLLKFPDEEQFKEAIRRRAYVRQLVLNGYANSEWFHIAGTERILEDADDGTIDQRVQLRPPTGRDLAYKVYAVGSTGQALPFMPGLVSAGFPAIVEVLDGWYQAGIPGDITYSGESSPLRFEEIPANAVLRSGVESPEYLRINDRELLRRLRGLLREAGDSTMPLRDRLLAVKSHMSENYRYSTTIENPGNLSPVENFLFHEKKGYCDFFATSGALLCRAMGVPARTAYGFATGAAHRGQNVISFRGNHAHSWTEIYLYGFGWTVFDLTPAGPDATAPVAPNATTPVPELSSFTDARSQTDVQDSLPLFLSFLKTLPPKAVYGAILVGFALLIALRFYDRIRSGRDGGKKAGSKRHRKRNTEHDVDYDPYPPYLLDLRKLCRLLGCEDDTGDTLRDLIQKLRRQGIELNPEFDAMRDYHYRVRYEGHKPSTSTEKYYRKLIRGLWKHYK